ncbi:hypothetical protein CREGCYN_08100 [Synechococcus sp. M16CYN]
MEGSAIITDRNRAQQAKRRSSSNDFNQTVVHDLVGALTRLEWDWFDTYFENIITIPSDCPGLKSKKGKNEHIPHHVTITS